MVKAILPGTFDPPTNGHLNLIERAAGIFEVLYVVIAANESKSCMFSSDERFLMMSGLLNHLTNVKVFIWDRLIVDFARKHEVKVMVRGVRALADFSYEFELAMTNKGLNSEIETMFLPTDPKYFVLRSSAIKEIASFQGDISGMVPPIVVDSFRRKSDGG